MVTCEECQTEQATHLVRDTQWNIKTTCASCQPNNAVVVTSIEECDPCSGPNCLACGGLGKVEVHHAGE